MRKFATMIFILACFAQTSAQSRMQEAESLYQAQKWNDAARAFEAITRAEPSNARAWGRLGAALIAAGSYEQATKALLKAVEIAPNPADMYNLACAYSRLNVRDHSFEWLGKALDAGFPQPALIANDADLANLRADARYKEIAARLDKAMRPCKHDPLHRQFDFWVGEWDVKATGNESGPSIGASRIEMIEDGCIILENWTGAGGSTGKSFNFYDRSLKKWRQVWVDNRGSALDFAGEYKDNQMRYEGETAGPNGAKTLQRLTFFNLGADRVRQFWEQSTDGGKTWTVAFDGTYIRKK
jgi:tetratricopeptide (TPR) repeat protein